MLPDGHGKLREYPVKEMHSLRISRASRIRFEREIGFAPESPKAAALARLNADVGTYSDELIDELGSVTPLGEAPVFDLTEQATSHFVANGLVVHNCSEYMFLNDTACNLASLNLMKFVREDGEFDVESFNYAARLTITAQEILVDNATLPHAADRGEQPQVPAARPGLRQPRRAAHEPRLRLRLRPGTRLRGRHHGPHARPGVLAERDHRPRSRRPVRRVRQEREAVPAGHRQASRRRVQHPRPGRAGRDARRGQVDLGRDPRARQGPRLPQRAGDRPRPHRHDRVHDGLRHDRHRARHRPHQVQEARR